MAFSAAPQLDLSAWYASQAAGEVLDLACPRPLVRVDEAVILHPTSARSRAAQDDPLFAYYAAQVKRSTSQSQLRKRMVPCKINEMVIEPHYTSFCAITV
jgi:hypothetical protein